MSSELLDMEAYRAELQVTHVKAKKELSFFTRYFFTKQWNKKFVQSEHHKRIWEVLERVLSGELTKVIINMPPRYGKTEIAVKNFIAYCLTLNAAAKFIHLSYSKTLALSNSEAVKDIIKSAEYQELYGNDIKIKPKSDSKEKWNTTEGGGLYATATGGQVTGFGAGEVDDEALKEEAKKEVEEWEAFGDELDGLLDEMDIEKSDVESYGEKVKFAGALIIDDPMKPLDADSDLVRERINERFDSTIRNRVNSRKTPIIIIMQRLHEDDLCGHLLKQEPGEWFVLSLPAIGVDADGNDVPLWEHKHTLEELYAQRKSNAIVFERQMQQNPMPKEGMMYGDFELYSSLPIDLQSVVKNYTDTADTGKDNLCSISYVETPDAMYPIDVYYTDAPMPTTEPALAKKLAFNKVRLCRIEYNNGGGGFKRQVQRQTRLLKNYKTNFVGFTQGENKEVRIFSRSAEVTALIKMPIGWDKMWPAFYTAVTQHSKAGKNAHDDAPDCLTGMVEFFGKDKQVMETPKWAAAMP